MSKNLVDNPAEAGCNFRGLCCACACNCKQKEGTLASIPADGASLHRGVKTVLFATVKMELK